MHEPSPTPTPGRRNSWPLAVTIIVVTALLAGFVYATLRMLGDAPGAVVDKGTALVRTLGSEAARVARAFNEKTVREEFVSHAAELSGTSRFQFATLRQDETFERTEAGHTAWGLISLPTVVVGARAPVDYTYYLDFAGPWEFTRDGTQLTVFPPSIAANPPALDVSALQFYTLEGSLWRNEGDVRERLRENLSAALLQRAGKNTGLVREMGRQKLTQFVEKWLADKFTDGRDLRVRVVFPEERPLATTEQKAP